MIGNEFIMNLMNLTDKNDTSEYIRLCNLWNIYNWSTEELVDNISSSFQLSKTFNAIQRQWLNKIIMYSNTISYSTGFNWKSEYQLNQEFLKYLKMKKPNKSYKNSVQSFMQYKFDYKNIM